MIVIEIFLAISGGLLGVIIGQLLALYRDEMDEREEVFAALKWAQAYARNDLSSTKDEATRERISKQLEEAYVERSRFLTPKGERMLESALVDIDVLNGNADEHDVPIEELSWGREDMARAYLSGAPDHLSDRVVEVGVIGTFRRFVGVSDPYRAKDER